MIFKIRQEMTRQDMKKNLNRDRTPPSRMATRHPNRVGGRGSEGPSAGFVWRAARLPVTWFPAPEAVWRTARSPATRTPLQGSEARQGATVGQPGLPLATERTGVGPP